MARDVLIVIGGAVLSAGAGLLVGRLWVLMRRRGVTETAAERGPDLAEALEREAAASARAPDDVEAHRHRTTVEAD